MSWISYWSSLPVFRADGKAGRREKMEQEKADKTLKATVRKAVESLEQQCQKMKQQLFEIKIEVKAKASEIVAEAKAKGKAALHEVSEFLGIRDKLESVRENVRKSIAETEHTINKLDAFGSGMREAGQKIANVSVHDMEKKWNKLYGKEHTENMNAQGDMAPMVAGNKQGYNVDIKSVNKGRSR